MDAPGAVSYDRRVNTLMQDVPRSWCCRVCGFNRYHRVSVLRKNGSKYETSFYACSACSVMFLNERRFDTASSSSPGIEIPPLVTPIRRRK